MQIATLIDNGIMLAVGCYVIFARKSITAKMTDPMKKQRIDTLLRYAGPAMVLCSLILAASSFATEKNDIQKIADAINAITPKMIDSDTRLDGAVAGPGKRLTYNSTLVALKADQINRTAWEKEVVPRIRASILGNPNTSKVQKEGITIVSRYFSSDRVLIDEIFFEPSK
jgi:hypothetical protein